MLLLYFTQEFLCKNFDYIFVNKAVNLVMCIVKVASQKLSGSANNVEKRKQAQQSFKLHLINDQRNMFADKDTEINYFCKKFSYSI